MQSRTGKFRHDLSRKCVLQEYTEQFVLISHKVYRSSVRDTFEFLEWAAKLMHVNRIMQWLIFDLLSQRALSLEDSSSENDQVPYSRWSTSDKINGRRRAAVVSENWCVYIFVCVCVRACVCLWLRESNLSNLSYIYYRTGYGIGRSVTQTDADNRFKLTPWRWIRYRGGRSFLIIHWKLFPPMQY